MKTNSREPPVKVGDEVELTIMSVGDKGDGIAKIEGFCIFVPESKQGETVWAKITNLKPNFAFAKIIERPNQ